MFNLTGNNRFLVGGLEHHEFYDFPYIGNNNHPNWLSYFSDKLKPIRIDLQDKLFGKFHASVEAMPVQMDSFYVSNRCGEARNGTLQSQTWKGLNFCGKKHGRKLIAVGVFCSFWICSDLIRTAGVLIGRGASATWDDDGTNAWLMEDPPDEGRQNGQFRMWIPDFHAQQVCLEFLLFGWFW